MPVATIDRRLLESEHVIDSAVEFYLDPVSPYVWLAFEQVHRIQEAGARVACIPVLFAGLLNAWGTKGPAEVPAKRAYVFRDVMRQAKRLNLPFQGPPCHPFNPLAALRVIQVIDDVDQRFKVARELCAAAWCRGMDISDEGHLRTVLAGTGMDADAILAASKRPENKTRLRNATQSAVELDIFGVPTFRFSGELFWGADRVDTLLWALGGGTIDDSLLERVLARPSSATRR